MKLLMRRHHIINLINYVGARVYGDDDIAVMAGHKALDLSPENSAIYISLGQLHKSQGRYHLGNHFFEIMRQRKLHKAPSKAYIIAKGEVYILNNKIKNDHSYGIVT